jgi:long-chain acyl-CoA synthetase
MNIAHWLDRQFRQNPQAPALATGAKVSYTYGQLALAAYEGSQTLSRWGISPGDRVGLYKTNHVSYLAQLWSIWWLGAVAVPMNERLHGKEAAYILSHSGAQLCLTDSAHQEGLSPFAPNLRLEPDPTPWLPRDEVDTYSNRTESIDLPLPTLRNAHDAAWLFYTSGTTGKPKGVTLTHNNLLHMTLAFLATVQPVTPEECFVHPAPLSHGSGLYHLPYVMNGGLNVVPESGGLDCAELFALAAHWRRMSSFTPPTIINRLAAHAREHGMGGAHFSTLVYGGAPMYLADLQAARAALGPVLAQIYGQGEAPMTITVLPKWMIEDTGHPQWEQRAASVGIAQPNVQVAILTPEGHAVAAGQAGEVCVKGDIVMAGYWDNPEATAAAIRDGWLYTGDIGRMDANGFLTLLDRSKDLVISGGNNIYPREIEEVLLTHPALAEVSVIGRPDETWGESVVAYVVRHPEATNISHADLDTFCLAQMARYKRPKAYRFVSALPKNNYGKVLKTELRRLEAQQSWPA